MAIFEPNMSKPKAGTKRVGGKDKLSKILAEIAGKKAQSFARREPLYGQQSTDVMKMVDVPIRRRSEQVASRAQPAQEPLYGQQTRDITKMVDLPTEPQRMTEEIPVGVRRMDTKAPDVYGGMMDFLKDIGTMTGAEPTADQPQIPYAPKGQTPFVKKTLETPENKKLRQNKDLDKKVDDAANNEKTKAKSENRDPNVYNVWEDLILTLGPSLLGSITQETFDYGKVGIGAHKSYLDALEKDEQRRMAANKLKAKTEAETDWATKRNLELQKERIDLERSKLKDKEEKEDKLSKKDKFTIGRQIRQDFEKKVNTQMTAINNAKIVTDLSGVIDGIESGQLPQSAWNPMMDISLIYTYVKTIDPDSVVKEGETGLVISSDSISGQLLSQLNKQLGEGIVNNTMRKRLINEVQRISDTNVEIYRKAADEAIGRANRIGVNPENLGVMNFENMEAMIPANVESATVRKALEQTLKEQKRNKISKKEIRSLYGD